MAGPGTNKLLIYEILDTLDLRDFFNLWIFLFHKVYICVKVEAFHYD